MILSSPVKSLTAQIEADGISFESHHGFYECDVMERVIYVPYSCDECPVIQQLCLRHEWAHILNGYIEDELQCELQAWLKTGEIKPLTRFEYSFMMDCFKTYIRKHDPDNPEWWYWKLSEVNNTFK